MNANQFSKNAASEISSNNLNDDGADRAWGERGVKGRDHLSMRLVKK